jgi:hypothetical protein
MACSANLSCALFTSLALAATAACGKKDEEPAPAKAAGPSAPAPAPTPEKPAEPAPAPVAAKPAAEPVAPAKDEPWRTRPPEVAADVPCPDEWWVIVDSKSFPPADLAGPIKQGHARPADGGGVAVKLANYELPTDPTAWSAADKPGHFQVSFTLVAGKGKLGPGTYQMGDAKAPLRLVSPGAGYHRGEAGTGGIGWLDKPGPTVEITAIDDQRICGRLAIDDGYSAIRGPFVVPRLPK